MYAASFLFHDTLNDFLPKINRGMPIRVEFKQNPSTKHFIESLGVPHVEVGEVVSNHQVASLDYHVQDGDQIEVQPAPPGCPVEPRFLIDNHLGRLAVRMRMLGFDSLYQNDFEDRQMAEIISDDPRILLTRDRRMLMRKVVQYGYCPRSLDPDEQLHEVLRRFDLDSAIHPFHRCLRCNGILDPVNKKDVLSRLEPLTRKYFNEFNLCRDCKQVYWKGSHYEKMQVMINNLDL